MDYWSLLLTVGAIFLAAYYYMRKSTDYFASHGIPYLKPLPIVGSTWRPLFRLQTFADMVQQLYRVDTSAKYIGTIEFATPSIVLRDPELIKTVWTKNFDHFLEHRSLVDESIDPLFANNLFFLRSDRWKGVRNVMSPAFTSSRMKSMFVLMSECGEEFAKTLATLPATERVLDIKDSFSRYATDVIASCAFGFSVNSMKERENQFYVYGKEATTFSVNELFKFVLARFVPWSMRLLGIRLVRKEIAEYFEDLIAGIIKTREEQGIVRPDMIQLFMESKEKVHLSTEDITAQAFIFFFGGFESTSGLMCFAAHEIAMNPAVQERLQEEIDGVLEENDGKLLYEAVNDMTYLGAVVNEALRMYPVTIMTDRKCSKSFELPPTKPGAKPLLVEEGTTVLLPIYGLHHDEQYFEEPEKFKPERFIENGKEIASSGAYIPFGAGPRMCIGNRFALLETKALLFHLLARCDLKACAKTSIPMKLSKRNVISLTAENGFWLEVRPRTNPHRSVAPSVSGAANE